MQIMKFFEKSQFLLEEINEKYFSFSNLSFNFITSVSIFKLIAAIFLILGEYSYLTWPICQNESQHISLLYPYAAFLGVILLGLTEFCLTYCNVLQCIRIELISSLLLGIVMSGVSMQTLRYCLRPTGLIYFLPEIYGQIVALVLFVHALIWYYKYYNDGVKD